MCYTLLPSRGRLHRVTERLAVIDIVMNREVRGCVQMVERLLRIGYDK